MTAPGLTKDGIARTINGVAVTTACAAECCDAVTDVIPGQRCICDPEDGAGDTVWIPYTGQTGKFVARVNGECYEFDPDAREELVDQDVSIATEEFPSCLFCCFFPEDPPEVDPNDTDCCTDEEDPGKCYYLVLDTIDGKVPLLFAEWSITASQAWGGIRDADTGAMPPEDCYSCVGPCATASGSDTGAAPLRFALTGGTETLDGDIELACDTPLFSLWGEQNGLLTDPGEECTGTVRCHACSDSNCQSDTAPISVQDGGGPSPFFECVDVPGSGGSSNACGDSKLCLGLRDLRFQTGKNDSGQVQFGFRPVATPTSLCFGSAEINAGGYVGPTNGDCDVCGSGEPDPFGKESCVQVVSVSLSSTCATVSASLSARRRFVGVCEDFTTPGPTCTLDEISLSAEIVVRGMYQCAVAEMMATAMRARGHSVSVHRAESVRIGNGPARLDTIDAEVPWLI